VLTLDRPAPTALTRGAAVRSWSPSARIATAAVVLSSISLGSAPFFVRRLTEAGLAPASMAFYRYAITAVVMARFLALSGPKRRATLWGLTAGAVASLGWIAYARSINQVDLATNGIAYMTYPAFTVLTCRAVFKRQTNARSVVAGALVIVAAAVALGPGAIVDVSPILFIAPATFGFSVAVLTERLHVLDPLERLSAVSIGATITLTPLVVTAPVDTVIPTTASAAVWVVAIGVICALLPMLLYGAAAPIIGGAKTAMAGTSELPTMFVIGALMFGEEIKPEHLIAGALIVLSIALTPVVRSIHVDPDLDGDRMAQRSSYRSLAGLRPLILRRSTAQQVVGFRETTSALRPIGLRSDVSAESAAHLPTS
jgi:drug/metabolite transporter (DMT)-like permease